MRKLMHFFAAILLLGGAIGLLVVSGAIYDAQRRSGISPYFFQPNNLSNRRMETPQTPKEMGDTVIRNMLVYKYINEYFYVAPDVSDIEQRIRGAYDNGLMTPLRGMSTTSVFEYWVKNQSEKIKDLAERNAMRSVVVNQITVGATGHLIVDYELKTWFTANDMYETPTTTKGRIYMDVRYTPGTKETWDALQNLEKGVDAAYMFDFHVVDIEE